MPDCFRDGDLVIDYRACCVWLEGREINLPTLRFKILSCLTEKAGQPVSQWELLRYAWPDEQCDVVLVRWHISRLRQDLNDVPPKRIIYVRGFGYRYDRSAPKEIVNKREHTRAHELHDRPRIRKTYLVSCKPSRLKLYITRIGPGMIPRPIRFLTTSDRSSSDLGDGVRKPTPKAWRN